MIDPEMATEGSLFFQGILPRGNGGVFYMLAISDGVECMAEGRMPGGEQCFSQKGIQASYGCPLLGKMHSKFT